jgi:hypothetical protein
MMEMKPEYNHGTFALKEERFQTIFPDSIMQQYNKHFWINSVDYFMKTLNHGNEYALDKWAIANNLSEAYRIAEHRGLYVDIMRIWWQKGKAYLIRTIVHGRTTINKSSKIVHDGHKLREVIRQNIPKAIETPSAHARRITYAMQDGSTHIVETWRNSTYIVSDAGANKYASIIDAALFREFRRK